MSDQTDFLSDPETFATRNVIIQTVVGLGMRGRRADGTPRPKAEIHYYRLRERDPAAAVENTGGRTFVICGGAAGDGDSFAAYYCPYHEDDSQPSKLGNKALFMFTDLMNGCSFGVGSQGIGSNGHVVVTHVNAVAAANSALPSDASKMQPGDLEIARAQQAKVQKMIVRSELGADALIMEPSGYMFDGRDRNLRATTFGFHDAGGPWRFFSLSWRKTAGGFFHGGLRPITSALA